MVHILISLSWLSKVLLLSPERVVRVTVSLSFHSSDSAHILAQYSQYEGVWCVVDLSYVTSHISLAFNSSPPQLGLVPQNLFSWGLFHHAPIGKKVGGTGSIHLPIGSIPYNFCS